MWRVGVHENQQQGNHKQRHHRTDPGPSPYMRCLRRMAGRSSSGVRHVVLRAIETHGASQTDGRDRRQPARHRLDDYVWYSLAKDTR